MFDTHKFTEHSIVKFFYSKDGERKEYEGTIVHIFGSGFYMIEFECDGETLCECIDLNINFVYPN